MLQRERATVVDAARFSRSSNPLDTVETERTIFVLSARGLPSEEFALGLTSFAETVRPVAVVLTGWIADDWIPEGTPVLVSLGASTQVASAVAQVLSGAATPTGSLEGLLPKRTS